MMAKDPERRFRTPADVADALAPFTKKGGVTLKPARPDVSREVRAVRPGPRTEKTLASQAPAATPLPETVPPAAPAKPEARWSSLIDFRDAEPKAEKPVPRPEPAGPARRPPWRSPKVLAAAAMGGLILMGIIITITIKWKGYKADLRIEKDPPPAPAVAPAGAKAPGVVATRFDDGETEGWSTVNHDGTAGATVFMGIGSDDHNSWLEARDHQNGKLFFWQAPAKYRGDHSDKLGKLLKYDAWTSHSDLKNSVRYVVLRARARSFTSTSRRSGGSGRTSGRTTASGSTRPAAGSSPRPAAETRRRPTRRSGRSSRNLKACGSWESTARATTRGGWTTSSSAQGAIVRSETVVVVGPVPRARVGNGRWTIEGDELVQSNDQVGARVIFGDPDWSDYDLTLEAQKVEGDGHGIEVLFHHTAPRTFAWFGLGVFKNKGCEMYFETDAKGSRASANNPDNWVGHGINVGEWYTIKLEVRKSHFKSYLDGQLVFEGTHGDHTRGRIGLNTGEIQARFRKIKVAAPDGAVLFEGLPELYPPLGKATAPALAVKKPAAPLFNGKDIGDWIDLLANNSEWKVVDGVLEGKGSGKAGGPGVLVLRRDDLKDFRLRARLRHRTPSFGWIELRRSAAGDLVNGYAVAAGIWPEGQAIPTGSIGELVNYRYGSATGGWYPAAAPDIAVDEWFDLTVDVYGDTVVTAVNGKKVAESIDPAGPRGPGGIALGCSWDARVEYKSITVEEWSDGSAAAPATADRRVWVCDGTTFENFEPGRWRELNEPNRRIMYFRESGRNERTIELFDPYRGQGGIWVGLGERRADVRQGVKSGWSALADGRWVSSPPAPPRITTAEAVRRLEEDVKKLRDPARANAGATPSRPSPTG